MIETFPAKGANEGRLGAAVQAVLPLCLGGYVVMRITQCVQIKPTRPLTASNP